MKGSQAISSKRGPTGKETEDRRRLDREAEPGGPQKRNCPSERREVENPTTLSVKTGPTYKRHFQIPELMGSKDRVPSRPLYID